MADDPSPGASSGGEGVRALTAAAIAAATGGTLDGDGDVRVSSVAPLDRAAAEHLTFLASAKYAGLLDGRDVGVLLVTPELAAGARARAKVIVANPHDAMLSLLERLYPPPARSPGVHPTAVLGRGVRLGDGVHVGAYVVLGEEVSLGSGSVVESQVVVGSGVAIGEQCHLHPHVTLYAGTTLGARVRVHAGARLGSDGFGYVFRDGAHQKLPHVGRCIVEDDVEIGANSAIDRGSIDDTVIGAGTKIDNLVHVAHNVRIGRLCLIMAQVGIAGSVRVEDGCILAGQVGISGHHVIGRGARLAAQAGVFGDIPAGETWSGYPARPHREALRAQAAMFRLPSLIRGLERLLAKGPDRDDR